MASISSDNEVEESEKQFILEYFLQGSTYDKIVKLLSKNHGIEMSVRTLKSRLHQYKLRRRGADYDIDAVRERIQKELDGTGCLGGYRSMWRTLCSENFEVPRRVVEHLMREMDPEGCKLRQAHRLKRRKYFSRGPNDVWHVDGYDKLKPYGFPIHGCIDGWSRRMMWLRVSRTNNNPEVVASLYLDCVDQVDGCPVTLRTDCGTENGIMASMQCDFRRDVTAHKYGTSPSNQRIEGWWAFLRKNWTTWWMNFFKDLIEQDLFHPGNELEMECMWFCFNGHTSFGPLEKYFLRFRRCACQRLIQSLVEVFSKVNFV